MESGHTYDLLLEFGHYEVIPADVSGFNTTGYVGHLRFLIVDMFAVFSPHVSPIVGGWQYGDGAADDSAVVVFREDGTYFQVQDAVDSANDGMERGTYIWDEETGELTVTYVEVDTNGDEGLSHPSVGFHFTVSGDVLTFEDGSDSATLHRVNDANAPIVGAWRICNNEALSSGSSLSTGVLVFLDNGIYFHAEVTGGDPDGPSGMERGTYTWNQSSGVLDMHPIVDTNGYLGGSDPDSGGFSAVVLGRKVLKITDDQDYYLYRVSNAAVMPGWDMGKSREYEQATNNTAPTTAQLWEFWAELETRNPNDATEITISGGGISGELSFSRDTYTELEWEVFKTYLSETALDGEFPDNQIYTITISGGELGTVSQEINIGSGTYPTIPYLTGTKFTDAQSIDPTETFELTWNHSGSASIWLEVTDDPEWEGENYIEDDFGAGIQTATIPVAALPTGEDSYGHLEFYIMTTEMNGGGFGVYGNAKRESATRDVLMRTLSSSQLMQNAASAAGLTGADQAPLAIPFDEGVSNQLKYAFNMDLSTQDLHILSAGSGNSGLPVYVFDDSGDAPVLRVEFIRRKGSGLVYTAMRSTTLESGSFTAMTGSEIVTDIDEHFERVVIEEPYNPGSTPHCFGRVEVVNP